MAFVLAPKGSVAEWLADLDAKLAGTPGSFAGRAAILDLSGMAPTTGAAAELVAALEARKVGVVGLEGVDASALDPDLLPLLDAAKPVANGAAEPAAPAQAPAAPASLVLAHSVRSGQSVLFPAGDVTVLGSVASGAEILAGGSVHVYGTLRGRAMAGSGGNPNARIFCQRIEAELLSIDGYFRSADDIDETLRGRPVQAWLEGTAVKITALN